MALYPMPVQASLIDVDYLFSNSPMCLNRGHIAAISSLTAPRSMRLQLGF